MKARPVIVLTVICLVIGALLAAVNSVTDPVIEQNAAVRREQALRSVMPGSQGFSELPTEGLPDSVSYAYWEESGMGYVFVLSTSSIYSSDPMGITVAIAPDGTISGILLTSYFESKDFGKTSYPQTYLGKDGSLEGVDTVSGVTYSSTAFKNAVRDAFTAFKIFSR